MVDDAAWRLPEFTKNRDRLLTTDMSSEIMTAVLAHREVPPLLLDDYFLPDGTLGKAWAAMKGFQPKGSRGTTIRAFHPFAADQYRHSPDRAGA